MPDTRIWILDSNGIPCKREEKGEIYIETEYMSLGYWNNKLNEGKFWKKIIDGKERLFYRTGDYGHIELREYLKKYIHKACIPKKIVFLDEIPLNENGKINYRLLKESYTQKKVEIS